MRKKKHCSRNNLRIKKVGGILVDGFCKARQGNKFLQPFFVGTVNCGDCFDGLNQIDTMRLPLFLRQAGVCLAFGAVLALQSTPLLTIVGRHSLWVAFCLFAGQMALYGMVFSLLAHLAPKWLWKAFFLVLFLIGACTLVAYYKFSVIMNPDMVENILATDRREAFEFINWRFVALAGLTFLPALFLTVLWKHAPMRRCVGLCVAQSLFCFALTTLALGGLFAVSGQFMPLMRQYRQARYLAIPAASIYSFVYTLVRDRTPEPTSRLVIDPAPKIEAAGKRPLFVLMVIGETARKQNWGLSGYKRQTTPELTKRSVVNFTDVTACATSTSVSLPCMFSRIGRDNYDRRRIEAEESILWVIERAGVKLRWLENQGGAKDSCPPQRVETPKANKIYCDSEDCQDMVLMRTVQEAIANPKKASHELMVLHTMGSHGPAYWRRTPADFRPFGQGCVNDDMTACTKEEVRDSYDNSIAYTDMFLASLIDALNVKGVDTVLFYVSDHGESLGERGMWLHGAPMWMAPSEQTRVPMVLWMNAGAKERFEVDPERVEKASHTVLSHDNIASTLLGLTEVKSKVWEAKKDILLMIQSEKSAQHRREQASR